MTTVLFWFRNDLRLHDQPALLAACASGAGHLLPVLCLPQQEDASGWGFVRMSERRRAWHASAVRDLDRQLTALDCPLLLTAGPPASALPALAQAVGADTVYCEDIAAPEEQRQVDALRAAGLTVHTVWQSSLLDPQQLPWPVQALPASFTPFRQALEKQAVQAAAPLPPPASLPPWPDVAIASSLGWRTAALPCSPMQGDPRSSLPPVPAGLDGFEGGETAALAHLTRYLARRLPDSYKRTRNGLHGVDFSSKFSPWLASGALSARRIMAELRRYEAQYGASEGSYWLWFELLWRDYFRFLHGQYGAALYRERGLRAPDASAAVHDQAAFQRWCAGATGQPLVDAAMRELLHTGYLSNRLRQVAASYLLNELAGDWRAGAAWFESQLLDYDVYSNQGNWLYIAGRGTDPRGGRHFNVDKQTAEYDGDGAYRRLLGTAPAESSGAA